MNIVSEDLFAIGFWFLIVCGVNIKLSFRNKMFFGNG